MTDSDFERSPGRKLGIVIAMGLLLALPIFYVWFLVSDRQSEKEAATQSITEGWGAAQQINGPVLILPYRETVSETEVVNGKKTTKTSEVDSELTVSPTKVRLATNLKPELRKRAIYEAVVYRAENHGAAMFAMPGDLKRLGVDPAKIDFARAELRFAISDSRGLDGNPVVAIGGRQASLQPGSGQGFFATINASSLRSAPLKVDFNFTLRGNERINLLPDAGDTVWQVRSSWAHPSFTGSFLPAASRVSDEGFTAIYRVGNLALGRALATTEAYAPPSAPVETVDPYATPAETAQGPARPDASVSLIQPVDPYSQVDRATKYGFLFIGFTFLALLMFDVVGGVRVATVEYLLTGAALVLFFVLLLALAEIIGFTLAYVIAAGAIIGLNTAYSAAVLHSWRRGAVIGGLLTMLYAGLFILLGLQEYSLLIGSVMLFAALAGVMYATRRINWSGSSEVTD